MLGFAKKIGGNIDKQKQNKQNMIRQTIRQNKLNKYMMGVLFVHFLTSAQNYKAWRIARFGWYAAAFRHGVEEPHCSAECQDLGCLQYVDCMDCFYNICYVCLSNVRKFI